MVDANRKRAEQQLQSGSCKSADKGDASYNQQATNASAQSKGSTGSDARNTDECTDRVTFHKAERVFVKTVAANSEIPLVKCIRTVWASNMMKEIDVMGSLVQKYNYVSVDSEFPGLILRYVETPYLFEREDTPYLKLHRNVNLVKVVQLGLTLFDSSGSLPSGICTWLFNFNFDLYKDVYSQDSIDALAAQGLNFDMHKEKGIDPVEFAEYLIGSGLVMMDNVTWVSFYGIYDYAFLLKLLTAVDLPTTSKAYCEMLKLHLPRFFDIQRILHAENVRKKFATDDEEFHLNTVATSLGIMRDGNDFQAGADSIMTMKVFLKLAKDLSLSIVEDHCGSVYGLDPNDIVGRSPLIKPEVDNDKHGSVRRVYRGVPEWRPVSYGPPRPGPKAIPILPPKDRSGLNK